MDCTGERGPGQDRFLAKMADAPEIFLNRRYIFRRYIFGPSGDTSSDHCTKGVPSTFRPGDYTVQNSIGPDIVWEFTGEYLTISRTPTFIAGALISHNAFIK